MVSYMRTTQKINKKMLKKYYSPISPPRVVLNLALFERKGGET
jgi:hypothetical protein